MKKICKKCNIEKPIKNFRKGAKMKDGYVNSCKDCDKIYQTINKDKISSQRKQFYQANRERILKEVAKASSFKRKELSEYSKQYYKENKEKIVLKKAQYYQDNKSYFSSLSKEYRESNKETISKYNKKYRSENKAKLNKKLKERRDNDPLYRMVINLRNRVREGFKSKRYTKNSKTISIIGCSFDELKTHLEGKFEDWMNWDNYGKFNGTKDFGWDIDHIIPLVSAKNEGELLSLCHFSNLQPLCSYTNRNIKGGRI